MRPGGKSNGESPFFEKPIFCRLRNGSGVCIAESGGLRCKDESSRRFGTLTFQYDSHT